MDHYERTYTITIATDENDEDRYQFELADEEGARLWACGDLDTPEAAKRAAGAELADLWR